MPVSLDPPVALPSHCVPDASTAAPSTVAMSPAHTAATEIEAATRLHREFVGFMIERSVDPSWVFPNLERMSLLRGQVVILVATDRREKSRVLTRPAPTFHVLLRGDLQEGCENTSSAKL